MTPPSTDFRLAVLRGQLAHHHREYDFWHTCARRSDERSEWARVEEYAENIRRVTEEIRALEGERARSVFDAR